jgi:hypothetical protein
MTDVVTFSLYIDGALRDRVSIPRSQLSPEAIWAAGERQAYIAYHEGDRYLFDIAWPDGTHTRFGTDQAGIVDPIPVPVDKLMGTLLSQVGDEEV